MKEILLLTNQTHLIEKADVNVDIECSFYIACEKFKNYNYNYFIIDEKSIYLDNITQDQLIELNKNNNLIIISSENIWGNILTIDELSLDFADVESYLDDIYVEPSKNNVSPIISDNELYEILLALSSKNSEDIEKMLSELERYDKKKLRYIFKFITPNIQQKILSSQNKKIIKAYKKYQIKHFVKSFLSKNPS